VRRPHTPTKLVSAAALFFNAAGELLIVKPHYRKGWLLPGGVVESNEAPLHGVIREVKEELNLEVSGLLLAAVDFSHERPGDFFKTDKISFLFRGGELSDKQIESIELLDGEILEYRFVSPEEALTLLIEPHAIRAKTVIDPKLDQAAVHYLHNGELVY